MACSTAKEAWDRLRDEFQGSDRTRQLQILNLMREFEILRMKESNSVKEYIGKVMKIVNQHGHIEKVCKNKFENREKSPQASKRAEIAEETLLMAQTEPKVVEANQWLLDSGVSSHMTPYVELFAELGTQHRSYVKIVLLVLEITQNLLNVGQMVDDGYELLFKDHSCKIYDPRDKYLMTVAMKRNCFPIDFNDASTSGLMENLPSLTKSKHVCSTCQFGKLTRKPYPHASSSRSVGKLDLVHIDVGGPMSEVSLNGNKFFLIFVDDLSRMCWIYFMKAKSEHIPEEHKDKLQSKVVMGVFIGYSQHSKAYRVYHVDSGKISISRNVSFDEGSSWNWDKPQHTRVSATNTLSAFQNISDIELDEDELIDKAPVRGEIGYSQLVGIDCRDTFAPVARLDTIRLLIDLSAALDWKIYHMDVKSAFLNGKPNEEIFIEQPRGFEVGDRQNKVYKLHKALYGLKQAPRAWYSRIDAYILAKGFYKSLNEATLYVKKIKNEVAVIVSLYVDDTLITGADQASIGEFKSTMKKEFHMSDLGQMKYFLGLEIHQSKESITLSQINYIQKVLKRFKMAECKPTSTPLVAHEKLSLNSGEILESRNDYRSLTECLLYICSTHREIMFAVSYLSRFMQRPSQLHLVAAKRVLRYLRGTTCHGINFIKNETI
ncbi:Uncharacterized protein TCM_025551 [Theobroma cacao]|uniref:Uncharacterized protein n=1 Tax=Theobroma cacao TaxID=3641 RepID=A0A061EZY5_THECC|nr:Uncharacterized protein TCM_025551 [Theobroma cacao]